LAGELAEAAGEYLSEDDLDPDDMTYEEVRGQGQAGRDGEGRHGEGGVFERCEWVGCGGAGGV
jgi:hypothetical protein